MTDDEVDELQMLQGQIEDFLDWSDSYRDAAKKRRNYRNGIQWTPSERRVMDIRGAPVLTFNLLGGKIGAMLGAEIVGRTDPKAIGRNPGVDEQAASVCTAALRYATERAKWNEERSLCRDDYYVEGTAAAEVVVEGESRRRTVEGNPEILINHIPWDRQFHDPHSRYKDFRDDTYRGYISYEEEDALLDEFEGDEKATMAIMNSTTTSASRIATDDSHDDSPSDWVSGHGTRRRIRRVVHWYKKKGEWWYAEYVDGGFFDGPRISPYVNEKGETQPGMIMRSCYVRDQNERFGIAEDMISPQDEVNKRRSSAMKEMNAFTIIATPGAVEDKEMARQEVHKSSGYVEKAPGAEFDLLDRQRQFADNLQLLQEAKSQLEAIGPSETLMGNASPDASGKAIERRQRSALLKYGDVLDGARSFELAIYQQVWYRMVQYWDSEQYVRITDDPSAPQYLGLNVREPVTLGEMLMMRGSSPEEIMGAIERGEISENDLNEVVDHRVVNNLSQLDMDIILDTGPDLRAMREEQLENLMALLGQVGQQLAPDVLQVMLELIVELSPLDGRIKTRFLQAIRPTPEQQQAQAQQAQEQQAVQRAAIMLDLKKKQADVEKTNAETEYKLAQAEGEGAKAGKSVAEAASKTHEMFTRVPVQKSSGLDGKNGRNV